MALILTIGTGQAFGAILEATTAAQKAVTEVQKKTIISGPVQTPLISAGPVLKSDSPIVGSHDWLAQEKAERDKLESDAAQTKAELEAEIAKLKTIADNTNYPFDENTYFPSYSIGNIFSSATFQILCDKGIIRSP
jgi:hypothetical protein